MLFVLHRQPIQPIRTQNELSCDPSPVIIITIITKLWNHRVALAMAVRRGASVRVLDGVGSERMDRTLSGNPDQPLLAAPIPHDDLPTDDEFFRPGTDNGRIANCSACCADVYRLGCEPACCCTPVRHNSRGQAQCQNHHAARYAMHHTPHSTRRPSRIL